MNKELEAKIQQYQQQLAKNPYPYDENLGEMHECEGCYCQLAANNNYDFCFDCLDCDMMSCGNRNLNFGNCCACFGKKQGDSQLKRKPLTFTQKQRLHFEQIKRQMDDLIEQIKDREDIGDMLTAQRIANAQRWAEQEKIRLLKKLTKQELIAELEKRN